MTCQIQDNTNVRKVLQDKGKVISHRRKTHFVDGTELYWANSYLFVTKLSTYSL